MSSCVLAVIIISVNDKEWMDMENSKTWLYEFYVKHTNGFFHQLQAFLVDSTRAHITDDAKK
ncbi:hypothetical protein DPMN_090224 [Dreissena polymorpha]|uniref:Uncharacterized protein n=1 Tax=Dreissena polymorpha TaxID=45954 RepID=A0A9D4QY51_DREPO|nr:hypothetical protein DPMN_090224 [Dreissena polymorpha]